MDIKELKQKIMANQLDDSPLILKHENNKYICDHYAKEIARQKQLQIVRITKLAEMTSADADLFDADSHYLYVYDVDKLEERVTSEHRNLIVITKSVPDNLPIDYIDIPALINWQIEDYVKMRLSGLSQAQVAWLCDIANHNIYRVEQECRKLEIFEPAMQKIIFDQMNQENAYCDLNSLTIFNFTNAVMRKDLATIHAVLADLKYIDIEGTGLITIFHKQFKNVIDIQLNPKATAATLNMSPKQFNAIKYLCGKYTTNELIDIYSFITQLDMRLKNGEFSFKGDNRANNAKFVEYITLNILALGHIA